jgi:hypothetical protein
MMVSPFSLGSVREKTPEVSSSVKRREASSADRKPVMRAICSGSGGLPFTSRNPLRRLSNIKHNKSIHIPRAAGETLRNSVSFIQSPG